VELPLESVADLECVVIRVDPAKGPAIDAISLTRDVSGKAVLFHTGWDRLWRTDAYFESHPHLTERVAERLANAGAALVGIDSMNIDSIATGARPVHTILLGNDIPIAEHLRGLAAVPPRGGRFSAVPVKVKGCGTFPVRAYVVVS
jgi:kynurenine formamidase